MSSQPAEDLEKPEGEQQLEQSKKPELRVIVSIRRAALEKLEDELRYANSVLNSPNVTDSPRWDKAVKFLACRRPNLIKEIEQLKSEIRAEEGMN